MRVLLTTLFMLPTAAWAQQVTFHADCLPGGAATFDFGSAVFSEDVGFYDEYTIDPVEVLGETVGLIRVSHPDYSFESFLEVLDENGAFSFYIITGSAPFQLPSSLPTDAIPWLTTGAWSVGVVASPVECSVDSVTSNAAPPSSLLEDSIGSTPGFLTVLDSAPAFDTSMIEGRFASLEQAADPSCTTVRWAGTQQRGRVPVVQGLTDDGGTIQGSSISNGFVDGAPFSASLASNGRVVGSTSYGTTLEGWFARVNSRKSIWYGVETDCND